MGSSKMIPRLLNNNWKQAITTSTHMMFFKRNWQCTIHRVTGEVRFSRRQRNNVNIMHSIDDNLRD
jgi:hypothetical protein